MCIITLGEFYSVGSKLNKCIKEIIIHARRDENWLEHGIVPFIVILNATNIGNETCVEFGEHVMLCVCVFYLIYIQCNSTNLHMYIRL